MEIRTEKLQDGQVIVRLASYDDRYSRPWMKVLRSVDPEGTNGYALEGEWLHSGDMVRPPVYIVGVNDEGSRKYHTRVLYLWFISTDGEVEMKLKVGVGTRGDMRKAILACHEILSQAPSSPPSTARVYLGNAFSLSMLSSLPAQVRVEELSIEDVRELLSTEAAVENVIGHPDTDALVRSLLALPSLPPAERKSIQLGNEDVLIVAQYVGPRLPEGATSLPEGAEIKWLKVKVK